MPQGLKQAQKSHKRLSGSFIQRTLSSSLDIQRVWTKVVDQLGFKKKNYHPLCATIKISLVTENLNKRQRNKVTERSRNTDLNSLWQV